MEFGRLIQETIPDFIFAENVPGLKNGRGKTIFRKFEEILINENYFFKSEILDAKDYGVPQKRRRFILVASKHWPVEIPDATHGPKGSENEIMFYDDDADPTDRKITEPQCKQNLELMPTSFSDLKHYIDCPYSYLLQQMMGFSPVINLAYGYGLQVHNFLNQIHQKWNMEPPRVEDVEALIESNFFLRFTREKPLENMKSKCKEIINTYVNEYGFEFPLKLETEKPFEFILEGALISGSIDLIQKIDPISKDVKDVSILDFKTEKEKWETKNLIRLQLRLYALAGSQSLGLDPKSTKVHYLTDNIRQEIDISRKKLEETKEQISDVIEGIKRGNFNPCPGKVCAKCDVKFVCNSST